MKSLYKLIFSCLIFWNFSATGQTKPEVNGLVTDADGPIPDITVYEKDVPTNGVSTDIAGKFKLRLKGRSNILIIRGIGYLSREVSIGNKQNTISIALETDAKGLEEVVVVGYGTQKKITKTGAISTLSREEIQKTPSASLQNALSGKIPGFFSQQRSGQPGKDGAQFYVRGVSTFSGGQQPLILVDDIEYSYNQFSNINPNEVESLTVLKDASTTAVYGIKGANGVILVTTRRGKTGPAHINFRSELGIQKATHTPQFLDAYQVASLRNEALGVEGNPLEFTQHDLDLYQSGADPYGHPNVDWYHTLFKSYAPTTSNNINISGGTDIVQYFFSLGQIWQDGMVKNFNETDQVNTNYNYKRYNLRTNLDIKATKSLSFKINVSGNYEVRNNPKFNGSNASGETQAFFEVYNYEYLNPYFYPIKNPDGSFGFSDPNRISPENNNIVGRMTYGGYTRFYQNLLNLDLSAVQKLDVLTKGLSVRGSISSTGSNSSKRELVRQLFPSFFYNSATGIYLPRDPNVYRVDKWASTYAGGAPTNQVNIQANLKYDHQFGKHNVNALVLYNQTSKSDIDGKVPENSYVPDNFRGYTLRAGYNYNEKYLFEINAGYNGTDRFVSANRFGFFPAASMGWNLGEEKFIKEHFKFVDLFKLRGSYGLVGNDVINGGYKYRYEEIYQNGSNYSFGESHNNVVGIAPGSLGNNAITWEKELKMDAGLDFALFNGKLTGTLDVFKNYRYDILTTRQTIAPYFGIEAANLPVINIGKVRNKGYEIELTHRGKINKFGYNIGGNFSYAKNKIVNMDEADPKYPWQQQTGLPIGMVKQWIFDGFYKDQADVDNSAKPAGVIHPGYLKYRDLNGDMVIDVDDRAYVGNPNLHNTNIGFTVGFNYKNFSMSTLLQSALNFDVQIGEKLSTPWKANLQPIHLKRWTPETAETAEFPVLITSFVGSYMTSAQASTFWSIRGNYLRLKSLDIGYQLPTKWAQKLGVAGAKLYANGYDLFTWSKSLNRFQFDPEVVRGGTTGIYPQQAIYNMGINVSFK